MVFTEKLVENQVQIHHFLFKPQSGITHPQQNSYGRNPLDHPHSEPLAPP